MGRRNPALLLPHQRRCSDRRRGRGRAALAELPRLLRVREVDFGINFIGASHAEIEFEKLVEDPFVLACRHDHSLASRKQVSWPEIVPHRVITVGRNSGNRALIDNALARHGLQLNWSYEVAHLSGSLGLVEAGLGIAVLPKLAMPAAGHPIIQTIRLIEPEVSRTIGIVRRRGATLSPHASQFLKMLLEAWRSPARTSGQGKPRARSADTSPTAASAGIKGKR
ncbi:LysR substrate-binding domain-containing protein [Bradyrhizobium sp. DASA03005]|uniref:LysR substrate-binding domain-containing protein n=1 Tax=unclassified Bradyrhizobium TaxID=2631580 RepID=UPI003F7107D4